MTTDLLQADTLSSAHLHVSLFVSDNMKDALIKCRLAHYEGNGEDEEYWQLTALAYMSLLNLLREQEPKGFLRQPLKMLPAFPYTVGVTPESGGH
jgi:hypothetical protein